MEDNAENLVGQTLGGYELVERIHVGASASIYCGEDAQHGHVVAVKVLHPALAADPETADRFHWAAERVAGIVHPNVVPVLAHGEEHGHHYVVMPLLRDSLRARLDLAGVLPLAQAVRIVIHVAAGVHALHAHGMLHGSVCPEHILITETGRALLAGFGTWLGQRSPAHLAEHHALLDAAPSAPPYPYLAPEQVREEDQSKETDVYALGALLYELLTGCAPNSAPHADATGSGGSALVPPSTHNPFIWPELDALVVRAMATWPGTRFHDAYTFAIALHATVRGRLGRSLSISKPAKAAQGPIHAPVAHFDAPGALLPALPSRQRTFEGYRLPPRVERAIVTGAIFLSLVVILACAGGGLALLRGTPILRDPALAYQQPYNGGLLPGTSPSGPLFPVPTAAATPTPTPTPRPTPTSTPLPTPTPRPKPTPTPAQTPSLALQPQRVRFKAAGLVCTASQTITNTWLSNVSWWWSSGTLPPNFTWSINGVTGTGYPHQTAMPAGSSVTLSMWARCGTKTQSYPITVTDSRGFTYTITLVVP